MNHKHTGTLLLISLLNTTSYAAVNMKDASFTKTLTDFKGLERTYNSRSLHDGIFGFGWCSSVEKKLDFSIANQVILKDCSQPFDIIYKNSVSPEGELLKFSGSKYFIENRNQKMVFNKNGELIQLSTSANKKINLTYDQSGFLRKIIIENKKILRLNYDYSIRKVKEVLSSDGFSASYQYKEQNLLQSIYNKSDFYKYKYDKLHNLLEIKYPDESTESISYNADTDRVLSHQDRKGCTDQYQYAQKENYMSSTLEKSCSKRMVSRIQFEFFEKVRADGLSYLDKLKINDGAVIKEITYDAFSGATKKITQKNALRLAASKGSYE